MALTRTALKERGVDKETIDFIMEAHGETIESTKEKLEAAAQKKIDALQAKVNSLPTEKPDGEDWKAKYDAEVLAHKKTINDYATEKTTNAQNKALHEALKTAGANEKFISLVIDKIDRSKAMFDGDVERGFTVKNSDDIVKPVKEQYGDIFGTVTTQGAGIATPPKNDAAKPVGHKDMNAFIRGRAE